MSTFNAVLTMEARLDGGRLHVTTPSQKHTLLDRDGEVRLEVTIDIDPIDPADQVPLLSVTGFTPGLHQCLRILSLEIGGLDIDPHSYFDLLCLRARGNPHIADRTIDHCHEICLDGELALEAARHRDRLFWMPYYHSERRDDFVFSNYLLNDYGPGPRYYASDPRTSRKVYGNRPHHDVDANTHYDHACFGCSVTYGTGLEIRHTWPSLLPGSTLNLAVPRLGIDGIFLNVKNALKQFKFKHMILLLPNFERRLLRVRLNHTNTWCRIPLTFGHGEVQWHHTPFKNWAWKGKGVHHNREIIDRWRQLFVRKSMAVLKDTNCVYGKRMLDRLLKLCEGSGVGYHVSSWSEEVYEHLQDRLPRETLLPFFDHKDVAVDNNHPGANSHRAWVDQLETML